MSAVRRYSNRKTISPENVLEHTGSVSVISSKIVDDLRKKKVNISDSEELLLYRRTIVHDMDEIVTGDIPRPTKYSQKQLRESLNKVEKISMRSLIKSYDLPKSWYDNWDNSKSGRVGLILVVADILSVVYKYWEERIILNNLMFDLVGNELLGELEIFRDSLLNHDESLKNKYELFLRKDNTYLDHMATYIEDSINILRVSENSIEFNHTGSVIGSFLPEEK